MKKFGEKVIIKKDKKIFVDLWQAALIDLTQANVLVENIEIARVCTYCEPNLFFSWRRNKGKPQAMAGVLGLRKLI